MKSLRIQFSDLFFHCVFHPADALQLHVQKARDRELFRSLCRDYRHEAKGMVKPAGGAHPGRRDLTANPFVYEII